MSMRTMVLSVMMLVCVPMIAWGQTKKTTAKAEVLCCGQSATADESLESLRLETQQNLQEVLTAWNGGKRLSAGDYLIAESYEGYEFRALVSRQGVVDGWYLADLDGVPMMLVNSNGHGAQSGGGYKCFIKYGQTVSGCESVNVRNPRPNRFQICADNAWDMLIDCLNGTSGAIIK